MESQRFNVEEQQQQQAGPSGIKAASKEAAVGISDHNNDNDIFNVAYTKCGLLGCSAKFSQSGISHAFKVYRVYNGYMVDSGRQVICQFHSFCNFCDCDFSQKRIVIYDQDISENYIAGFHWRADDENYYSTYSTGNDWGVGATCCVMCWKDWCKDGPSPIFQGATRAEKQAQAAKLLAKHRYSTRFLT